MPGSVVSTRSSRRSHGFGSIGHHHHARVLRIADPDAAAVMDGYPRRARRSVHQRVEQRPIGDGVRAVEHALGFAIGRRHRAGIQMIAADHDRRFDLSAPHIVVDAPGRTRRARHSPASRCARAVPGSGRDLAPAASSAPARRSSGNSSSASDRWRGCPRAIPRAPPSGTVPCLRRTAGECIRARSREYRTRPLRPRVWPACECCCRSRTSRRPCASAPASPRHVGPSRRSSGRVYSSGIGTRSARASFERHAVRHVAVAEDRARWSDR